VASARGGAGGGGRPSVVFSFFSGAGSIVGACGAAHAACSACVQILYGLGFSEEDLRATVPVIHSNVIASMQALCKACVDLAFPVTAGVRVALRWGCTAGH
jgi:hypothetical protein